MVVKDGWRTIRPGTVEELPEAPGVVVLGSLVRNVLLVANASQGIRAAVQSALSLPELRSQVRCVRVEASASPEERHAELLAAYRDAHGGALPPAQARSVTTAPAEPATAQPVALVPRRESPAPARIGSGAPRSHPGRYPAGQPAPTFLRVRTVA
jgi:hypothetical protein